MRNQDNMQAAYTIEYQINTLFDHMETRKEFVILINSPFFDRQLAHMGVAKILTTQEYTHAYCM